MDAASGMRTSSKRPRAVAVRSSSLAHVARAAGVSPATVSRVINQPSLVADATVERVRKAIGRLSYVPNRIAGGLASRRTGLVALIVPSIVHSVFNDTIQAMTEALTRSGYQVMLGLSGYSAGDVSAMLQSILSRRPDGIIMTGFAGEPDIRRQLLAMRIPVIETWELPAHPLDMAVGFSHRDVGVQLAEFAFARGYQRPFLIVSDSPRSRIRASAFMDRWRALGGLDAASYSAPLPSTVAHGRAALQQLGRDSDRDVVVCSSDWLALGVLVEARVQQRRVPQDLGLIGFGNLDFASDLEPALTTVRVDGAEIGRQSARLLLERTHDARSTRRQIDVGAQIIERGTCRRMTGAT